ncbi:hypothetical protein BH93_24055 [Rhodococcoides fascians A25f]|uniref:hypothetical protein n=1 Tax=Rhodococcoides fascians TaxID=1828 RepID=UPI000689FD10|nr:hypothetical protein [Rhodococcus fascians]QII08048.1 hypothetical protein BH93_24055 [Rhodococcus fascians A25f]
MAEDIVAALGGSASWDPNVTVDAPTPGYPPRYFEPVEVLRCERALSTDNVLTLDSARLRGDVDAAMGAFAVPSKRFASGITASCAYEVRAPAGLWFVDASGRAFRPAWPAEPCGLRDEPLRVLNDLDEVSRSVYPTGYDHDYATLCSGPATTGEFYETSDAHVASAVERQRAGDLMVPPALVAPTDDVGFLQICTYPVFDRSSALPTEYGTVPGTSFTLDRPDSIELLGYIADAPVAQPCSTPATRFAWADLRRPDGSGTARITVELDGCRRVAGLGFLRELPLEAYDVLARDR